MMLHEVVRGGDLAAVRDLIAAGAKIDERDKLKRTALHIAAWAGHFEIVQMLVRVNATLDVKAMDAFTPLHFAAQSSAPGAAECIRFLARKNKALLRMPITKGNKSPIHLAVAKGVKANIIALLEAGADPTAKTTSGQTALDLARTPEVRQLLEDHIASKSNSHSRNDGADGSDGDEVESEDPEGAEDAGVGDVGGAGDVGEAPVRGDVDAGVVGVIANAGAGTAGDATAATSAPESGRKRPISELGEGR
mmetsp:Transcript_672/g.1449  ORF Transcript_672/g.1449 Transcript_672/m.1449 type:complete len:250 (-) Transcript_672:241-990(-)